MQARTKADLIPNNANVLALGSVRIEFFASTCWLAPFRIHFSGRARALRFVLVPGFCLGTHCTRGSASLRHIQAEPHCFGFQGKALE